MEGIDGSRLVPGAILHVIDRHTDYVARFGERRAQPDLVYGFTLPAIGRRLKGRTVLGEIGYDLVDQVLGGGVDDTRHGGAHVHDVAIFYNAELEIVEKYQFHFFSSLIPYIITQEILGGHLGEFGLIVGETYDGVNASQVGAVMPILTKAKAQLQYTLHYPFNRRPTTSRGVNMPDNSNPVQQLLGPYRVLDLTDHRGLLCGKILADLGADVVQVEPPGGSPARELGPFYQDQVEPEKSFFWWAYTANKRGITLDIESTLGQRLLLKLAGEAHFIIESFSPGYLDGLGLGYTALSKTNPSLVMVSISPFGKDGPYANYKAPDIVGTAMGGFMWLTGDADRPPVRVSFPHFYLHGSAAGATGAMLAHTHRALTGEGQHVDVSCQQAVARTLAHAPQHWDVEGNILTRMGVFRQTSGDSAVRTSWPCKDGYINYSPGGGGAGVAASTRALLAWMNEEGLGDEFLESVDWEELGYGQMRAEIMAKAIDPLIRFFATHTRAELVAGSVEKRILLFPVSTQEDILAHPHLQARQYFKELDHPELGITVTYPGIFIKDNDREMEGQRVGISRRPPLIAEHNLEIYQGELGISDLEMAEMKAGRVI